MRCEYQAYVEKKLGGEWDTMRDWGGKIVGAMVRIAALMHCAEVIGDPTETPVSVEVVLAAISIAEYLGAHAAAAYQVMGANADTENAKYILKRLYGRESISRTELTRLCRGKFTKSDDMNTALTILEDQGYIRTSENPVGYNNRRQVVYNINPSLWRK